MKIELNVTCPLCGGELEGVANDDPKGWATRERRLVLCCIKRHCNWGGVIVAELIDLARRRAA